MEFGAAGGKSVMMDTTRGRAHVPAQLGLARAVSCIRSCRVGIRQHLELPASQCWR